MTEQVDFDASTSPHRRAYSEIGNAKSEPSGAPGGRQLIDQACVDAIGWQRLCNTFEIRRGESDLSPAPIARDDLAGERMRTSQHEFGLREVPSRNGSPHPGARKSARRIAMQRFGAGLKATIGAESAKQCQVSFALATESEVLPHEHLARAESCDQHLVHEHLWGETRQLSREGLDHDRQVRVDPEQELHLAIGPSQQLVAPTAEYLVRMRMKRQHQGSQAVGDGAIRSCGDHCLVATMHAVVVADGDQGRPPLSPDSLSTVDPSR